MEEYLVAASRSSLPGLLVSNDCLEDFSHPRAPDNVTIPKFAMPIVVKKAEDDQKGGAGDFRKLMMTPRTVAASVRAFSSVVYVRDQFLVKCTYAGV